MEDSNNSSACSGDEGDDIVANVSIEDDDDDAEVFVDYVASGKNVPYLQTDASCSLPLDAIPDLMGLDIGTGPELEQQNCKKLHERSMCDCPCACCKYRVWNGMHCRPGLGDDSIESTTSFERLPPELFLHICSFLDAKCVRNVLGNVCSRFRIMVTDKQFWKNRISHRWPKLYPAVADENFDWASACEDREVVYDLWTRQPPQLEYTEYKTGLFGDVSSVHLLREGQMLAIGCRDASLHLLDLTHLNDVEASGSCMITQRQAHTGWIWSLSSCDNMLATGSWDSYVKFWQLGEAHPRELNKVKCLSAVLCSYLESGVLYAGTFAKSVVQVDPRTGDMVSRLSYHQQAVLSLVATDKYVITGSEDKTIRMLDRRTGLVTSSLTLSSSYPTSLSLFGNELWVGGGDGRLHVVDLSEGSLPSSALSYDVGHAAALTGVIHTRAATYTSSKDHTIKVLEPSLSPGVIAEYRNNKSEICRISLECGTLAAAYAEACVGIWRPHSNTSDT